MPPSENFMALERPNCQKAVGACGQGLGQSGCGNLLAGHAIPVCITRATLWGYPTRIAELTLALPLARDETSTPYGL